MQANKRMLIVPVVALLVLAAVAQVHSAPSKARAAGVTGWSHLYIRARDVEKTFRFYRELLGMEYVGSREGQGKTYYYLRSGPVRICIGARDEADENPGKMWKTWSHDLHLEVKGLSDLYERIKAAGYAEVSEPRTSNWGGRTLTLYDPNGVAVALTEWTGKSDWDHVGRLDRRDPFPPEK